MDKTLKLKKMFKQICSHQLSHELTIHYLFIYLFLWGDCLEDKNNYKKQFCGSFVIARYRYTQRRSAYYNTVYQELKRYCGYPHSQHLAESVKHLLVN